METLYCNKAGITTQDNYLLVRSNLATRMISPAPKIPYAYQAYKKRLAIKQNIFNKMKFFAETMQEKAPNFNLDNFFRNIQKLKVIIWEHKQNGKRPIGLYIPDENRIFTIESDDYSTFYHELFHLSNKYTANNISYVGFSQVDHKQKTNIGKGIEEGYNSLITRRYFGKDSSNMIIQFFWELVESILMKENVFKRWNKMDLLGIIEDANMFEFGEDFFNSILAFDAIVSGYGDIVLAYQDIYKNIINILAIKYKQQIRRNLTTYQNAEVLINQKLRELNIHYYNNIPPHILSQVFSPTFQKIASDKATNSLYFERVI